MNCKFYLSLGSNKVNISSSNCIEVSDQITNLNDIKLSYVRSDYGGVIRKCASAITLTGKARDSIIDYYTSQKLKSIGAFAVYQINDNWTYDLLFSCPLDFSTFKYDEYTAQISCLDNSVAAILNSNNNTKYEILVDDIKEDKQLFFDGVRLLNTVKLVFTGNSVDNEAYTIRENVNCGGNVYYIPPISYAESDIQVEGYVRLNDQSEDLSGTIDTSSAWATAGPNTNRTSYFLEALKDVHIDVDISSLSVKVVNSASGELSDVMTSLYKIPVSGNPVLVSSSYVGVAGVLGVDLHEGEKLQLCLHRLSIISPVSFGVSTFYFYDCCNIKWNVTGDKSYIDVVKPESLLNAIIRKMGMESYVNGDITFDDTSLENVLLVAGESIRGFNNAKLYTSFSDFCKFMEVVAGMVYVIESGSSESIGGSEGSEGSEGPDYDKEYSYGDLNIEADNFVRNGKITTDVVDNLSSFMPDGVSLVQVEFFEDYMFFGLGSDGIYYFINFPGIEKYLRVTDEFAIEIIDKNVLYDTESRKYYITDTKNKKLDDLKIDTLDKRYNHIAKFGGFVIDSVTDSGKYNGSVKSEDIFFSRSSSKFLYRDKSAGKYYSIFDGYEDYQKDGRLNPVAVFVDVSDFSTYDDGASYVAVDGKNLILYDGNVPLLPDRNVSGIAMYSVSYEENFVIRFVHRDSIFVDSVAKSLDIASEPEYSVSSGRIYSSVKIGYEKQDYDLGNNGKDEFNSTIEYSTGINLKEQTLDFLCPYRADSYGFQELARKKGNQTSDSESDNNTFIVHSLKSDSRYNLDRSIPVDGVYTDTVFNARLFPHYLIDANKRYLASYTSRLLYTSSEIMDSITVNSKKIDKNVSLSDPLFLEGDITVKTNDFIIPDDWKGYVEFQWEGKSYRGYLSSLEINVCNNEVFEYKLIEC